MNILTKISLKNLKLNKKRTIGTIIGIILSTALICASFSLGTSLHKSLVQNAISETGYHHLTLYHPSPEYQRQIELNRDVKNIQTMYDLGDALFPYNSEIGTPYIHLYSLKTDDFKELSYQLLEGRLPENNQEIVLSKRVSNNSDLKIGDTIELQMGQRKSLDGQDLNYKNGYNEEKEQFIPSQKKKYTVVGFVYKERTDVRYYGITANETSKKNILYITLKKPKDYKSSITGLLKADTYDDVKSYNLEKINYDFSVNQELLRWEVFAFSDSTIRMLCIVIAVVVIIIIITSVFCIRNSFAISANEKRKMYGMLSSIGATKHQRKKAILYEGFFMGIIGIPIGIFFGIFAVYVLVYISNILLAKADLSFDIIYSIQFIWILLSILLGFVTIYFSALSSARKIGKISPLECLRGKDDIKIQRKKLKSPKIIEKIFHIGGVIAYKNLKRSKKKYRTTVISLTVSIFVFITMNTFITESFRATKEYYTSLNYNILVTNIKEADMNRLKSLYDMKDTTNISFLYESMGYMRYYDLNKVNKKEDEVIMNCYFDEKIEENICDGDPFVNISIIALDDQSYQRYVKELGLDYEKVKNKAILADEYTSYHDGKEVKERRYQLKANDQIQGVLHNKNYEFEIAKTTNIMPYGLEHVNYIDGFLILNYETVTHEFFIPFKVTLNAEDSEQIVKKIHEILPNAFITDIDQEIKNNQAKQLLVCIFLYGFITVITCIGVTNIFNTITANMELRQKEFAMLKSIGMTKKEFNHMIHLETIFYSTKSLCYGIILGLMGSYAIYRAFGIKYEKSFQIPWIPILLSIIFVFILVFVIMKYSMTKINKQNIIDTIRKENV